MPQLGDGKFEFVAFMKEFNDFLLVLLQALGKDALPLAAAILGAVLTKGASPTADAAALAALGDLARDIKTLKDQEEAAAK